MGDCSQMLGAWSTLHGLQAAQQAGECPLQVADGLNLLQAAGLVSRNPAGFSPGSLLGSEASLQLNFHFSLEECSAFIALAGRSLVNPVSFREFLGLLFSPA